MADNYDNVCAICGQIVKADTLYYCCPECHRTHRNKWDKKEDKTANETEKEVLNQSVESDSKQP